MERERMLDLPAPNRSIDVRPPDRQTIVFVHHAMKRGGGSEQVLFDLIRGLDAELFRPVLCCLYELGELGEELKSEGVDTYEHLIRSRFDPGNAFRIANVLKREKATVLYVTDGFHNMILGRLGALLARTPVAVVIFHTYDTVIRRGTGPARKAMLAVVDKLFHPTFDIAIALAESHRRYLSNVKGIRDEKLAVVYNGIDLEPFRVPADRQVLRSRFQIPPAALAVGMVAGLRRWKAHDMFLEAAARVLRELPETYFVVAGDGPERAKLEKLAVDLGISSQVRFLGVVHDVPALLKCLDVSVLSSLHEAFPLVLLESMAAERPVVATDVGSVSEIVDDGVNGYLVPAAASGPFADAILRLLRSPETARRFGQAGRRKVEQHFTVERMVRRSEALLLEGIAAESR